MQKYQEFGGRIFKRNTHYFWGKQRALRQRGQQGLHTLLPPGAELLSTAALVGAGP